MASAKKTVVKSSAKLRVGVVGVGGMGTGHCRSITGKVPEMKLTAVADICLETAESVGKEFGVPAFASHRALIKSGLCEAVIVATPHPSHAEVAIACMKAGLHVISEKPLTERISTAEKMVAAARKYKVTFAVMFQRRFEPVIKKAIEIVRKGEIGAITRATLISPEYRTQAYYDSGTWRATWSGEGGGVMLNQSPHIMDIFIQLAGMPKSVCGTVDTRLHHIEVEDFAEATMRFKDGGSGYFYCSTNEQAPGQMIEVVGDRGKLTYRNGQMSFIRYKVPVSKFTKQTKKMWCSVPQQEVSVKLSSKPTAHFSVMRNFARHILKGEELVCAGETGLASLELANAITLSSFTNKEVKLPISRRAYDQLLSHLRKTSTFKKKAGRDQRVTDPNH